MAPVELLSSADLITGTGEDGIEYGVRPFQWDMAKAEYYKEKFFGINIFSDDVPRTLEGFIAFVMQPGMVWFEVVDIAADKNVGFMYVGDLAPSWREQRFLSATWHAVVWDSKAAPRREIAKAFIAEVFKLFRLHRLNAVIPLKFGGAIRNAKRLGFVEEGVLRGFRQFNGEWFGALMLSILEDEVNHG